MITGKEAGKLAANTTKVRRAENEQLWEQCKDEVLRNLEPFIVETAKRGLYKTDIVSVSALGINRDTFDQIREPMKRHLEKLGYYMDTHKGHQDDSVLTVSWNLPSANSWRGPLKL